MNKTNELIDSDTESTSTCFSDFVEDPIKRCKCPYIDCAKSYIKPSKLEAHMRIHTGEKPFKCRISGCGKEYYTKDNLRKHQNQFHFKLITCIECPRGCGLKLRQNSLQKHILRKHNKLRHYEFKCEDCGQGFRNENELTNHSHDDKPSFTCDKCSRQFMKGYLYRRHYKSHKEYECLCKAKFYDFNFFRTHKKNCEDCKPTCKICDKMFVKSSNLKQHVNEVHIEKNYLFKCSFEGCTKKYYRESSLKLHIKSSHVKKDEEDIRLICSICSKVLKNNHSLSRHMMNVHVKVKINGGPRKQRSDKNKPKKPILTSLTGIEVKQEENSE